MGISWSATLGRPFHSLPLGASWKKHWKTNGCGIQGYPKYDQSLCGQFGTHLYRRCFEVLRRAAWTRFCRTVASGSKEHSEYKGRCTFKGHGPFVALSLLHLSLTFDNLKNKQKLNMKSVPWKNFLAPPTITTLQQCICLKPQRVPTNVYQTECNFDSMEVQNNSILVSCPVCN